MIDFETWIIQHKDKFDEDVYGLFYDSVRCLKYDIDRPAYLLAYQGMMQYVKMVVLKSEVIPTGFVAAGWEKDIRKPLMNPDKWDETAFKCVQQQTPAIMCIPKEAREKFPFWRQFRNVAAHYKDYDLHKAHTLALYSFIEQFLFQLSVERSAASLAQQFDNFYNPSLTSVNADIKPLLGLIDLKVTDADLPNFLVDIRKSCAKYDSFEHRYLKFLYEVIHQCPLRIKEAACAYLNSDDALLNNYLEDYPTDIAKIIAPANAYQYLHISLPFRRKKFIMLSELLAAGLIADADKDNAIYCCLRQAEDYDTGTDYYGLSGAAKNVLADNGVFKMFIDRYFNGDHTSGHYQEICYKTNFYIGMISIMPNITKEYVEALIDVGSRQYIPYTLQGRLSDMYRDDVVYKKAVDDICIANGLTLPTAIV